VDPLKSKLSIDSFFATKLSHHETEVPKGMASWDQLSALLDKEQSAKQVSIYRKRFIFTGIAAAASLVIVTGLFWANRNSTTQQPLAIALQNQGEEEGATKASRPEKANRVAKDSIVNSPALPEKFNALPRSTKKKLTQSPAKVLTKGIYLAKEESQIVTPTFQGAAMVSSATNKPNETFMEMPTALGNMAYSPIRQSVSPSALAQNDSADAESELVLVSFIEGKAVANTPAPEQTKPNKFWKFLQKLWRVKSGEESIKLPLTRFYAAQEEVIDEPTTNQE